MSLLEIGPGSGYSAFRLARRVQSITLLDIAAGNIAQLRQDLGGIRNLDFLCADSCAPELANVLKGRFDGVYGLEVLPYLPDPKACLKNLAASLRMDGYLLLQWPNYAPGLRSGRVTSFRTRAEVDGLLREAGFRRWEIYALRLRPYANFLFRELHERPLRFYRRRHAAKQTSSRQVFAYDQTWAFQNRQQLRKYKHLLHAAWGGLITIMRLRGDCFECVPVREEILNRNLLLIARR